MDFANREKGLEVILVVLSHGSCSAQSKIVEMNDNEVRTKGLNEKREVHVILDEIAYFQTVRSAATCTSDNEVRHCVEGVLLEIL